MPEKKPPMTCPKCGGTMNAHAEKLVDPRDPAEAARMDPVFGAVVEEFNACPGCGAVASRPA